MVVVFLVGFLFVFLSGGAAFALEDDVEIHEDGSITIGGLDEPEESAVVNFFTRYRTIITYVTTFATITMLLLFVKGFIMLGASGGNPNARKDAINSILITGISTACLGTVTFIMAFFFNAFDKL